MTSRHIRQQRKSREAERLAFDSPAIGLHKRAMTCVTRFDDMGRRFTAQTARNFVQNIEADPDTAPFYANWIGQLETLADEWEAQ